MTAKTHALNIGDIVRTESEHTGEVTLRVDKLNLFYGDSQALKNVSMDIPKHRVTAFIGPSGCGKSTLLRCFNRMNDLVDICRVDGRILLDGKNIYDQDVNVALLRRRVGMVFQKPNPFPKSIYENVAYGLRVRGVKKKSVLDEHVEEALRGAALWEEAKDRLHELAFNLSGGQQQRLCIARTVAVKPVTIGPAMLELHDHMAQLRLVGGAIGTDIEDARYSAHGSKT